MSSIPGGPGPALRAAVLLVAAVIGWSAAAGCAAHLSRTSGRSEPTGVRDGGCLELHRETIQQRSLGTGVAGSGRVHFSSAAGKGRASFDFVFHRPDFLRLQFLSPLGPSAAVLDLDGERWLFADFREGIFIRGGSGADDFSRLTGLPSEPRTLISILLAEPLPGDHDVARLLFDPDTCRPISCELQRRSSSLPPVAVEFVWPAAPARTAEGAGERLLPERVCFLGPEPHQQTIIRFKTARQLTHAEQTGRPEPVDISGLRQVVPDAEDDGLPGWLR